MPDPLHLPSALARFLHAARAASHGRTEPSDAVLAIAPLMMQLAQSAADPSTGLLQPEHRRSSEAAYTRNLIFDAGEANLSLYAIVWRPGQWTPVHDHGSWGVVSVVEGVLEERSYVRLTPDDGRNAGIQLARGGVVLLPPGAVSTFVPNPDHIHVTGVPEDRPPTLSLHLYGRTMSDFNIYDVAAGTRRRIAVAHNES